MVAVHVHSHGVPVLERAVENRERQGIGDGRLEQALEGARSVDRVVAVLGQPNSSLI